METFATIGLVGNLVQFIDFSCKLFEQADPIYRWRSGNAQDLETIAENLQNLSLILKTNAQNCDQANVPTLRRNLPGSKPPTTLEIESRREKLTKGCQAAAEELLSALHDLRARKTMSKSGSFRSSLKYVWREGRINDMEKRLDAYRLQVAFELQVLQKTQGDEAFEFLEAFQKQSYRLGVVMTEEIGNLKNEMRHALQQLSVELERQSRQQTSEKHSQNAGESQTSVNVASLAGHLVQAGESWSFVPATFAILSALRFADMSHRYAGIREAHTGTYEWAFSNHFSNWLESPDSLFWVTGKPGSGKSTLMKCLVNDHRTTSLLRTWSGEDHPIIASYFYWIKGNDIQRSQEGLLRCLLYDYLRQCPKVLPTLFPDTWATAQASIKQNQPLEIEWRRDDLLQSFSRLAALDTAHAHLCLFIDGLDEYQGDYQELVETIKTLSLLKVKLCVASRPWNVFQEGFNSVKSLQMQDLNAPDIRIYVKDKLFQRKDVQYLRATNTDMDAIIRDVTEKSHGVFLWVYLVVRSLIEGLRHSDSMIMLHKRLRTFPSDLNDFFRDILASLDPIYRNKTAQTFQMTLASSDPRLRVLSNTPSRLTTLTHWYLDELDESPDLVLSMPRHGVDARTIVQYSDAARERINDRCKGLLEMTPKRYGIMKTEKGTTFVTYWSHVDFLHRTVADFLETKDIQQMLDEWLDDDFDIWSSICRASLAETKATIGFARDAIQENATMPAVLQCLSTASIFEKTRGSTLQEHLDELEVVLNLANKPIWENLGLTSFGALAMHFDLLIYVKICSESEPWSQSRDAKLELLKGNKWMGASRYGLTPEMTCLIHSIGLPVLIDSGYQRLLLKYSMRPWNDEDFLAMVQSLSTTAYFGLTFDGRFIAPRFHGRLVDIIGEREVQKMITSGLGEPGEEWYRWKKLKEKEMRPTARRRHIRYWRRTIYSLNRKMEWLNDHTEYVLLLIFRDLRNKNPQRASQ